MRPHLWYSEKLREFQIDIQGYRFGFYIKHRSDTGYAGVNDNAIGRFMYDHANKRFVFITTKDCAFSPALLGALAEGLTKFYEVLEDPNFGVAWPPKGGGVGG